MDLIRGGGGGGGLFQTGLVTGIKKPFRNEL